MLNLPTFAGVALALVAANGEVPLVCGDRTEILTRLADHYKEAPVGIGLASNGGLMELLTNESGRTWTLIITAPNGASCVVAEGEAWQQQRQVRAEGPGV